MNNPFPPTTLADFTISDPVSKLTLESIVNGKIMFPAMRNAFCLWGMPGTGKTTLAEMLPAMLEATGNLYPSQRAANLFMAEQYWHLTSCGLGTNSVNMMLELDKRAKSDAILSPGGYFYEILDEVDLLTPAAQGSLKSTITHAKSTIFILTTNHRNKLDKALLDRCFEIEMNQPSPEVMENMGRRFLRQMGLTGDEIGSVVMQQMAKSSKGSLRDFGSAVQMSGLAHLQLALA